MNTTLHHQTPSTAEPRPGSAPATSSASVDFRVPLVRGPARLPWRADGDELPASDVVAAARSVSGRPGAFLLGGGDPLRRADLATLLRELSEMRPASLGLSTPGTGVTTALVERLRSARVQRLVVPFHCARQDAHDWLVGRPGALKAALRAIRAAVEAGMPVTAEVVVTRPTMPHLAETVDVLTRVGVRSLCLRRLAAADVDRAAFAALSPRLSLLAGDLERAATTALQRRARLVLRDFPVCVAPRLQRLFAAPGAEVWLGGDGTAGARVAPGPGCPDCPGDAHCAGVPSDYVARFGWEEFADAAPTAVRLQEGVAAQQAPRPAGTMVLSWRGPRRMRCEACADADRSPVLESTRVVRARLVDAARHRPALLRLVGAELLAHPSAAALLFDAVRLFSRVECAGEGSAIVGWTDVDLRRLKDLARIDVALYGPDPASHDAHCGIAGSFASTLRGVARLREQTAIPVGAYAVVHDAQAVGRFADAWSRGELPGEPRFRLAATGAALGDLVACAGRMPDGAARSALLRVLPRCLCDEAGVPVDDGGSAGSADADAQAFGVAFGRRVAYAPCGSDPVGAFAPCDDDGNPCTVTGCPGTPLGWQRNARSERWMLDS